MEPTFTQEELAAAIERLGWHDPGRRASLLVKNILAHREPEWREGDVVRDALGRKYVWHNMGWDLFWAIPGTTVPLAPARPLTRLKEQ